MTFLKIPAELQRKISNLTLKTDLLDETSVKSRMTGM